MELQWLFLWGEGRRKENLFHSWWNHWCAERASAHRCSTYVTEMSWATVSVSSSTPVPEGQSNCIWHWWLCSMWCKPEPCTGRRGLARSKTDTVMQVRSLHVKSPPHRHQLWANSCLWRGIGGLVDVVQRPRWGPVNCLFSMCCAKRR